MLSGLPLLNTLAAAEGLTLSVYSIAKLREYARDLEANQVTRRLEILKRATHILWLWAIVALSWLATWLFPDLPASMRHSIPFLPEGSSDAYLMLWLSNFNTILIAYTAWCLYERTGRSARAHAIAIGGSAIVAVLDALILWRYSKATESPASLAIHKYVSLIGAVATYIALAANVRRLTKWRADPPVYWLANSNQLIYALCLAYGSAQVFAYHVLFGTFLPTDGAFLDFSRAVFVALPTGKLALNLVFAACFLSCCMQIPHTVMDRVYKQVEPVFDRVVIASLVGATLLGLWALLS